MSGRLEAEVNLDKSDSFLPLLGDDRGPEGELEVGSGTRPMDSEATTPSGSTEYPADRSS